MLSRDHCNSLMRTAKGIAGFDGYSPLAFIQLLRPFGKKHSLKNFRIDFGHTLSSRKTQQKDTVHIMTLCAHSFFMLQKGTQKRSMFWDDGYSKLFSFSHRLRSVHCTHGACFNPSCVAIMPDALIFNSLLNMLVEVLMSTIVGESLDYSVFYYRHAIVRNSPVSVKVR